MLCLRWLAARTLDIILRSLLDLYSLLDLFSPANADVSLSYFAWAHDEIGRAG